MTQTHPTLKTIPTPEALPFIGQMRSIDPHRSVQSLTRMLLQHGPVMQLTLPGLPKGGRVIMVGSHQLVNELSDDTRFDKRVHSALNNIRDFAGDGLFTAHTHEPNWHRAHAILMPAFGPLPIREMFPQMQDIAEQMLTRWERFGPDADFDVADQMTRLTLDTIALCAFDYRFNSFYRDELHPMIDAMVEALSIAGSGGRAGDLLHRARDRRYERDIEVLNEIADEVIRRRKADPHADEKNDLLARMLRGRDPETGEGLSDENIRYQLVTFLIAGHETTSGLLSFALHALLQHPEVFGRARAEIDAVVGGEAIQVTDLPKLPYVDQILKETLRLWPTAPAFAVSPFEKTVIGNEYEVTPDDTLMVILPALHRDLAVWGPDVERFDPDRFSEEALRHLPENAWKPFGNGQRACIGRPFAMQEAQLVLASIIQRFDLTRVDDTYRLDIKETLTLKPDGLRIRARLRGDRTFRSLVPAPATLTSAVTMPAVAQPEVGEGATPLLVLYGSESGSCEAFARRIGAEAAQQHYRATVQPLDEHAGRLPKEGAVVIVTASYEGQPPANARQFVAWAETRQTGDLSGVKYTVFGCGNRDWHRTYQAIPKKLDTLLEAAGAERVKARGEADARGDFFGDFERWYGTLWSDLGAALGQDVQAVQEPRLQVEIQSGQRSRRLQQDDVKSGRVNENRELVNLSHELARSKRHIEVGLPEGMTYRTGDYLAVLPTNPESQVGRVLKRFNLAGDDQITIQTTQALTTLPTHQPLSVGDLLGQYVELGQPATRKQVEQLVEATRCPPEKVTLQRLLSNYDSEVLAKRVSVLDLLERVQGCELGFADFLGMLPSLKPRQYSISSSPLWKADACTLTVAVVDAPAKSGQGQYQGVASTFLRNAEPGTRVQVAVRPSNTAFHPPADPATPIVMICAGTGLAPFHGFLQERALQHADGQEVGEALLFFGCDHPEVDFLYRDELLRWQDEGVVSVRPAFTFQPDGDVTFVQHRLWQDRADVIRLFHEGAHFYVCGDGRLMAPAVRETLVRIYQEAAGEDEEAAGRWADDFERTSARYAADVFA
ncbi:bifunctional cytochrome P450/NADPH--P450 reductase [Deinococcus wulumuqiensis]|uniref:bifunctional cytochrome P450/NADPH--P450 reductase n=1 Tax=Deinococcus wulumuqiensis TaxID=980427 RepID=UPI00242F53FC|nr:cytochrome P450 [Deinococcus wulumuqiensis]